MLARNEINILLFLLIDQYCLRCERGRVPAGGDKSGGVRKLILNAAFRRSELRATKDT